MHFSYASRKENYLEITWFIQLSFSCFCLLLMKGKKMNLISLLTSTIRTSVLSALTDAWRNLPWLTKEQILDQYLSSIQHFVGDN